MEVTVTHIILNDSKMTKSSCTYGVIGALLSLYHISAIFETRQVSYKCQCLLPLITQHYCVEMSIRTNCLHIVEFMQPGIFTIGDK